MKFSDRRREKKFLKIRKEVLENRKLLSYEDAIGYTNHILFQDCHIMQEVKNGEITGNYYLISEEMAKRELEKETLKNIRGLETKQSLQERLHYEMPVMKYHNYQASPRYHSRDYSAR